MRYFEFNPSDRLVDLRNRECKVLERVTATDPDAEVTVRYIADGRVAVVPASELETIRNIRF